MGVTGLTKLKRNIKAVLTEAEVYTPELVLQIELLARNMEAYRRVSNEFFSLESQFLETKSREGYARIKVNPLGNEMRLWADVVRKDLSKLTMNIKDNKKKATVEDEFTKLMRTFQDDDDDE